MNWARRTSSASSTEPESALVKQFAKLLSLDGVELIVTDGRASRELAALAIRKGTGARALRARDGAPDAGCDVRSAHFGDRRRR
jgi:hypothetical protein